MTAVAPVTRRVLPAQAQAAQTVADLLALPEIVRTHPVAEWNQHWTHGTVGHLTGSDSAIIEQVTTWAALFDTVPVIVHPRPAIDGDGVATVEPGWAVVHLPGLSVTIGGVLRTVRRPGTGNGA